MILSLISCAGECETPSYSSSNTRRCFCRSTGTSSETHTSDIMVRWPGEAKCLPFGLRLKLVKNQGSETFFLMVCALNHGNPGLNSDDK